MAYNCTLVFLILLNKKKLCNLSMICKIEEGIMNLEKKNRIPPGILRNSDCIPPHIDNHDFIRPFCTVSFLSKCNIIFGHKIKIVGPGEFIDQLQFPFLLSKIYVTFRKMDKAKQPHNFKLDSDF
ncbi:hypothetical protein IEQ34_008137 [Dendrobium chrysotoxum]|uniref:Uncharacterized protein n=1 Tax=Dendrobium chrysotoxum TaxID=161865 RepID=A0AAV7H6A3_DENCH|nr:hypothetical protein IEQ34_008137 [Dendrobium chrysotoxum]